MDARVKHGQTLQLVVITCVHVLVFYCVDHAYGKVVGSFVLPHGGLALDPRNFNTTNKTEIQEANTLHKACLKVGSDVRNVQPDVIFLSTPHGLSDYNNFLVYSNSNGSGFGVVDDCLVEPCTYNLSVSLDANLAATIYKRFGSLRNVSLLSAFGPQGNDNAIPLRWGEVIPLLFVNTASLPNTRVVVFSQSTRRYDHSGASMVEELLKLGGDLYDLLEDLPERVAMVISSDLAHTHKADGPYGYSNTSQPFDNAIGLWAVTLDAHYLLDVAAGLVDRALSCGFTGIVMLQEMLQKLPSSSWSSRVYANLHPSYYGMMAATFQRLM